jgi:hypothetical protein
MHGHRVVNAAGVCVRERTDATDDRAHVADLVDPGRRLPAAELAAAGQVGSEALGAGRSRG